MRAQKLEEPPTRKRRLNLITLGRKMDSILFKCTKETNSGWQKLAQSNAYKNRVKLVTLEKKLNVVNPHPTYIIHHAKSAQHAAFAS